MLMQHNTLDETLNRYIFPERKGGQNFQLCKSTLHPFSHKSLLDVPAYMEDLLIKNIFFVGMVMEYFAMIFGRTVTGYRTLPIEVKNLVGGDDVVYINPHYDEFEMLRFREYNFKLSGWKSVSYLVFKHDNDNGGGECEEY